MEWSVVGANGMTGGSDDAVSGCAAKSCCWSSSRIEVNGFMGIGFELEGVGFGSGLNRVLLARVDGGLG